MILENQQFLKHTSSKIVYAIHQKNQSLFTIKFIRTWIQPKVLILDEPTTGLDVIAAKIIIDFIESFRNTGTAVIFSTHHLHEVEQLCDHVAVIDKGVSSFFGSIDEFRALADDQNLYHSFMSLINAA